MSLAPASFGANASRQNRPPCRSTICRSPARWRRAPPTSASGGSQSPTTSECKGRSCRPSTSDPPHGRPPSAPFRPPTRPSSPGSAHGVPSSSGSRALRSRCCPGAAAPSARKHAFPSTPKRPTRTFACRTGPSTSPTCLRPHPTEIRSHKPAAPRRTTCRRASPRPPAAPAARKRRGRASTRPVPSSSFALAATPPRPAPSCSTSSSTSESHRPRRRGTPQDPRKSPRSLPPPCCGPPSPTSCPSPNGRRPRRAPRCGRSKT
mmetsp:Transcript_17334/g.49265  ORF Transcript_17334/g.49265 Transcript_17334/m.49265 type:complete len:263 (+) Transcript_17334:1040-1828(+)